MGKRPRDYPNLSKSENEQGSNKKMANWGKSRNSSDNDAINSRKSVLGNLPWKLFSYGLFGWLCWFLSVILLIVAITMNDWYEGSVKVSTSIVEFDAGIGNIRVNAASVPTPQIMVGLLIFLAGTLPLGLCVLKKEYVEVKYRIHTLVVLVMHVSISFYFGFILPADGSNVLVHDGASQSINDATLGPSFWWSFSSAVAFFQYAIFFYTKTMKGYLRVSPPPDFDSDD